MVKHPHKHDGKPVARPNAPFTSPRPVARPYREKNFSLEAQEFGDMEFEAQFLGLLDKDSLAALAFNAGKGRMYTPVDSLGGGPAHAGAYQWPSRMTQESIDDYTQLMGIQHSRVKQVKPGSISMSYDLSPSKEVWMHEYRHDGIAQVREFIFEDPKFFADKYGADLYRWLFNFEGRENWEEFLTELGDDTLEDPINLSGKDGGQFSLSQTIQSVSLGQAYRTAYDKPAKTDQEDTDRKNYIRLQQVARDLLEARKKKEFESKKEFAEGGLVVPFGQMPMSAGPGDVVIGRDELGNKLYRTVTGETYLVSLNPDQRTTRTKIEEDVLPVVKDWLGKPVVPTVGQVGKFAKDAITGAYGSLERGVRGTGTYGDIFNIAGNVMAASLAAKVPKGNTLRMGGGPDSENPKENPLFKQSAAFLLQNQVVDRKAAWDSGDIALRALMDEAIDEAPNPWHDQPNLDDDDLVDIAFEQLEEDLGYGVDPDSYQVVTTFYNPILSTIEDMDFGNRGLTGTTISKYLEKRAHKIRTSLLRSVGGKEQILEPDRRYSKEETLRLVRDNSYNVEAVLVTPTKYSGLQRVTSQYISKDYSLEGYYGEIVLRARPVSGEGTFKPYSSTHGYGQDTLAHTRFSIRTNPETGDSFILVEEMQSDLVQSSKEGKGGAITPQSAIPAATRLKNQLKEIKGFKELYPDGVEIIDDLSNIIPELEEFEGIAARSSEDFKKKINFFWTKYGTTTDEWYEGTYPRGRSLSMVLGMLGKLPIPIQRTLGQTFISTLVNVTDSKAVPAIKMSPIDSTTEFIRPLIHSLIMHAKEQGITTIVLPDSQLMLDTRKGAGGSRKAFIATYDKAVDKVLKELTREMGVDVTVGSSSLAKPLKARATIISGVTVPNTFKDNTPVPLNEGIALTYFGYLDGPSGVSAMSERAKTRWLLAISEKTDDEIAYLIEETILKTESKILSTNKDIVSEESKDWGVLVDNGTLSKQAARQYEEVTRITIKGYKEDIKKTERELEFYKDAGTFDLLKTVRDSITFKVVESGSRPTRVITIGEGIPKPKDTQVRFSKGGLVDEQMELALKGGEMRRDPVSGNDIPPGSSAKEVRDDIDIKVSEGEYIFSADVAQYYGVKYLEGLRVKAKEAMGEMEAAGRMGGEPEDDDLPFSDEELMYNEGPDKESPPVDALGFSDGGIVGAESKVYTNNAGQKMTILFTAGHPSTPIPPGYYPLSEFNADHGEDRETRMSTEGEERRSLDMSQWDIEDFERLSGGGKAFDAVTTAASLIGGMPGLIFSGVLKTFNNSTKSKALEEVKARLSSGTLSNEEYTRLSVVQAKMEQDANPAEKGFLGNFLQNGILGALWQDWKGFGGGGLFGALARRKARLSGTAYTPSAKIDRSSADSKRSGANYNISEDRIRDDLLGRTTSTASALVSSPTPISRPTSITNQAVEDKYPSVTFKGGGLVKRRN